VQFQQNVAVAQHIEDHSKYIVPVKSQSSTPIPWFLQMYHVLEISTLLRGKQIEEVQANDLTENDIDMSLMKSLVHAISSKAEKLVTKVHLYFSVSFCSKQLACKFGDVLFFFFT